MRSLPTGPKTYAVQGYQGGSVGGVFAETPDRVFVFQRGCLPVMDHGNDIVPERNASGFDLSQKDPARHPRWDHVVLIYNRDGKLVESWEQHNKLFVRPHRVKINPYDPQRHIWIIDDGAHSIYKFTNDGKQLVMTLGQFRQPASDQTHFGRPTDVAWLPNGDFFVSDGYVNTRVVKFNADGKFLLEWGQRGEAGKETRPSYFNTVHGIQVDAQRRVYVADRANRRVQIFDENGKYLNEWYTRFPYYIYMSRDQHLWVGDGQTNKILKYRPDRQAALFLGHLRHHAGRHLGAAPVQRRHRQQPVHCRRARRSCPEVPAEGWREPGVAGRPALRREIGHVGPVAICDL